MSLRQPDLRLSLLRCWPGFKKGNMMFRRVAHEKQTADASLDVPLKPDAIMWHIARYDGIRDSTASRASLLVSANALLLAGTAVLLSFYGDIALKGKVNIVIGAAFLSILGATLLVIGASIWFCVGAVAAYKTRQTSHFKFASSVPSRFLFNWGDTIRSSRDFEGFYKQLIGQSEEDVLRAAASELWTALHQHAKKHRNLRIGIRLFRAALILFIVLAAVVTIHRF
jgi:hypothetical protein